MNSSKVVAPHCEGMGFAIPSNTIKSVVDDLIDKGYVSGRVKLGISGKMVSHYRPKAYSKDAYELTFLLLPYAEDEYKFNEETGEYEYAEE